MKFTTAQILAISTIIVLCTYQLLTNDPSMLMK